MNTFSEWTPVSWPLLHQGSVAVWAYLGQLMYFIWLTYNFTNWANIWKEEVSHKNMSSCFSWKMRRPGLEMVTGAKKWNPPPPHRPPACPLGKGRYPSICHGLQHPCLSLPDTKVIAACYLLLCFQCYFLRVQEGAYNCLYQNRK